MRMFEHVVLVMLSRYLAAKTFKSIPMFKKCLKANFIPPPPICGHIQMFLNHRNETR